MKKQSFHKGFTLIELLVVVAIIAILSGTILVALNSARSKAKDARVQSELQELESQMELYYSTLGNSYGGSMSSVATGTTCTGAVPFNVATAVTNGPATLVTGIYNDAGGTTGTVDCGANTNSWTMDAKLSTGAFWCVDSNGVSKSSTSTYSSTAGFYCQ